MKSFGRRVRQGQEEEEVSIAYIVGNERVNKFGFMVVLTVIVVLNHLYLTKCRCVGRSDIGSRVVRRIQCVFSFIR
jgi:hypothetical protein